MGADVDLVLRCAWQALAGIVARGARRETCIFRFQVAIARIDLQAGQGNGDHLHFNALFACAGCVSDHNAAKRHKLRNLKVLMQGFEGIEVQPQPVVEPLCLRADFV